MRVRLLRLQSWSLLPHHIYLALTLAYIPHASQTLILILLFVSYDIFGRATIQAISSVLHNRT